jgi:phosphoribosylamine--glycine ligase
MTLPFMTQLECDRSVEAVKIMIKAIQEKTGKDYHGIVAGQMMLTEVEGPTIIEMYSRLGDPEALNVLAMMKNALYFHDDSIPPKKEWFGKKKKTHIGRMVFY